VEDPSPERPRSLVELAFDACYCGAVGGSVVAIFFLIVDAVNGQALFTPALMGTVLFAGADAATVDAVRIDMVAYYTGVHFASFGALGVAVSVVVHEVELHARHPALLLVLLFAALEGGFALAASAFLPGVIERVGPVLVAFANLMAAGGIGLFLLTSHQPAVWQRAKHAIHIA